MSIFAKQYTGCGTETDDAYAEWLDAVESAMTEEAWQAVNHVLRGSVAMAMLWESFSDEESPEEGVARLAAVVAE